MGFPAAGECGLNNKWQQWELGWRTLALEKQAEKINGCVVSVQGDLSTSCCLALAKERGTGYGPSLQLHEPKRELLAGTRHGTAWSIAP